MLHQLFTLGGLSGQVRLAKAVELRAGWRASGNTVNPLDESGLCIRSSYAGAVRENPNSDAIDVVADVKTERVLLHDLSIFFSPFMIKIYLQLSQFQQLDVIHFFFPTDCSYRRQRLCWLCNLQGCSFKGYRSHKSEQVGASLLHRLMGRSSHLDDRQWEAMWSPAALPKVTGTCITSVYVLSNQAGKETIADHFWQVRDVFYANWDELLVGVTAVVSTLGGFGSDEQMQRINGEANVVVVNAAKDYGIPKFILISVHDYNLPSFLLQSGYFKGKRRAESEVLSKFPSSGVVLRPAFIYGKRKVNGVEIPLDLIGEPVEKLLRATESFIKPLNSLPASDLVLAPPVSVDDVAYAVINAIKDDDCFGIFTIEQIKEAAAGVKV
ncbi:putative programmed cell death protein 2-like isoform X1 [Capsicum annuum]|nr:putative programmed cell death protein 2-like isoform X1 [Capsicum annuum]